jgi:uncharacterized RDD family membrane protein YckC
MNDQYPEIKDRIQATFIDTILIIIVMFIVSAVIDKYDSIPNWLRTSMFVSLFVLYEPLCQSLGFTLGNLVKGIRVRKSADPSKRINIFQAIIRYPIKFLLGWISLLTIGSDSKRRAIHDLVSGSVMIKL